MDRYQIGCVLIKSIFQPTIVHLFLQLSSYICWQYNRSSHFTRCIRWIICRRYQHAFVWNKKWKKIKSEIVKRKMSNRNHRIETFKWKHYQIYMQIKILTKKKNYRITHMQRHTDLKENKPLIMWDYHFEFISLSFYRGFNVCGLAIFWIGIYILCYSKQMLHTLSATIHKVNKKKCIHAICCSDAYFMFVWFTYYEWRTKWKKAVECWNIKTFLCNFAYIYVNQNFKWNSNS